MELGLIVPGFAVAATLMVPLAYPSNSAEASEVATLENHQVAYEYSGHLRELCSSQIAEKSSLCPVYVGAVLEVVANGTAYGRRICLPPLELMPISRAVELTMRWLIAHPEQNVQPASLSIVLALAAEFPCKS